MKYCDDYAALLDLYIDGELSSDEMAAVQAHLDKCPGCRAYVDDILAIRAAFPSVDETEVPVGFAEGVMASIQAQSAASSRKAAQKSRWPRLLVSLAACCAVVLLVRSIGFPGIASKSESAADTSASIEMPYTVESDTEPADETCDTTATNSADSILPYGAAKNSLEDLARADSPYFAILTLPTDALEMEALTSHTVVRREDGETQYELPADDYAVLLDELDASGIQPLVQEQTGSESGTALVIVTDR